MQSRNRFLIRYLNTFNLEMASAAGGPAICQFTSLADGAIHPCFNIDCSVTGVAVSAAVQSPVGMLLAVGACVGRLLPNGIAVKFVEQQTGRDPRPDGGARVPAAKTG